MITMGLVLQGDLTFIHYIVKMQQIKENVFQITVVIVSLLIILSVISLPMVVSFPI